VPTLCSLSLCANTLQSVPLCRHSAVCPSVPTLCSLLCRHSAVCPSVPTLCSLSLCADTLQSVLLHTNLWFCFCPAVSAVSTLLQGTVIQMSILCRAPIYIFLLDIFVVSAAHSQLRCLPTRPICTPAPAPAPTPPPPPLPQLPTNHCC
jgi:hypothetical protein